VYVCECVQVIRVDRRKSFVRARAAQNTHTRARARFALHKSSESLLSEKTRLTSTFIKVSGANPASRIETRIQYVSRYFSFLDTSSIGKYLLLRKTTRTTSCVAGLATVNPIAISVLWEHINSDNEIKVQYSKNRSKYRIINVFIRLSI